LRAGDDLEHRAIRTAGDGLEIRARRGTVEEGQQNQGEQ
jgi:hypothetical protein